MSVGKIIFQTGVMIVTGKVVSEGYESAKKWVRERKSKAVDPAAEEKKEVGSVTQMDE